MKRAVIGIASALLLVVSCNRGERPAPTRENPSVAVDQDAPRSGGILLRRLESDVATLNPVMATSIYDRYVDFYLFTPLVHLDAELKPIPGLATAWDISKDGRQYTFHLERKATFSDGTPVLAGDVLFTLRKIIDPHSEAFQVASGFEQIDMANTRVVDDHTIVIAFREVLAAQLTQFNNLLTIPARVYGSGDFKNDFNSRAVGCGPYVLTRREPGREIVLERRADYWGTKPHIQTIVFKIIDNEATAWNALKRGDVDETLINSDVWRNESQRPELQQKIDFRRSYRLNFNYIAWNARHPLFGDKRVRRALAMCIDLGAIINNAYYGTARAMTGPFTPEQWAYNPAVSAVPFDPIAAKRILTSIGWLDTNNDGVLDRNGRPFVFDMYILGRSAAGPAFAQTYQAELAKIGVKMTPVQLDTAMVIQRVLAGNYQSAYMSWELDPDPDPFPILHSSQFPPRGQNFVYYANSEADRLIEQGRRELDIDKRIPIYRRLHEILAEEQPYTWTVQVSNKWAINKRVRGVKESKGWGLLNWYPGELDWWIADQRVARSE